MSRFKTLGGQKWEAARQIDEAAGEARKRHITDIPGQQAVYMTKLAQSHSYLAAYEINSNAKVPPYIAAEAAATDQSAAQAASAIINAVDRWDNGLGPDIERIRLTAKRTVSAAGSQSAIERIVEAAIEAFARVGANKDR